MQVRAVMSSFVFIDYLFGRDLRRDGFKFFQNDVLGQQFRETRSARPTCLPDTARKVGHPDARIVSKFS